MEKYAFSYNKKNNVTIIKEKVGSSVLTATKTGFVEVLVKTEGSSLIISY